MDGLSGMSTTLKDTKLQNVLEECRQERKQFLVDEYARTEAENQLENLKNVLDSFKCE